MSRIILERRRARGGPYWLVAAICLAALGNAHAAGSKGQAPLPINIQADHANFAQKSGVSVYTDNVRMTRGGLTLTGHKLVVTRLNDRGQIKAVLTGSPAHIDKQPDKENNDTVTGHARQIDYTNADQTITLRGNADVLRDGDRIRGAVITHNIRTGATRAQSSGKDQHRVRITIQTSNSSD